MTKPLTARQLQYRKLLRSPEWKAKREEIVKRDGYKCRVCNKDEVIEVHHCYYQGNTLPWEYPDESLVTLCDLCHDRETAWQKEIKANFVAAFCARGVLTKHGMLALTEAVDFAEFQDDPNVVIQALAWALSDSDIQASILKQYKKRKTIRSVSLKDMRRIPKREYIVC